MSEGSCPFPSLMLTEDSRKFSHSHVSPRPSECDRDEACKETVSDYAKKKAGYSVRPFRTIGFYAHLEWTGETEYQAGRFAPVRTPEIRKPERPAARRNSDPHIVPEIRERYLVESVRPKRVIIHRAHKTRVGQD